MKTNPIFCLISSLTILVALVSPMSQAGLLLWGFEDKAHEKDWEVVNGQWEVENGVFRETSGKDKAMHAIVGDANWDKYTIEAKIRLDKRNWAGLLFS